MRSRGLILLVTSGMLVSACQSDSKSDAATTTTTAAPSTSPVPTLATIPQASAPASITPFVLCFDSLNGGPGIEERNDAFYFGYENSGSDPVVIDDGNANVLASSWADDHPLVPTVFAPGRVPVAFLAVVDTADPLPSWSIAGPDGQTRVARATGNEPPCASDLVTPPAPDTRDAHLEYQFRGLPEGAASFSKVEVTATLVGLPPTSVCAAGLDPRPVRVAISDGTTSTDGTTAVTTADVDTIFTSTGATTLGIDVQFTVRIVDECASGSVVSSGWPVNQTLADLITGTGACASVVEQTIATVGCAYLPQTGGVRIAR